MNPRFQMATAASFSSVHKQVIQEHQFNSFLTSQITSERENIGATLRKLISSYRSFCLLDISSLRLNDKDGKNAIPFSSPRSTSGTRRKCMSARLRFRWIGRRVRRLLSSASGCLSTCLRS
jgi:hypothetical protein